MRLMLLGHQRHDPVVRKALDHLQIEGKVAMITAKEKTREILAHQLKGIAFSSEQAHAARGPRDQDLLPRSEPPLVAKRLEGGEGRDADG